MNPERAQGRANVLTRERLQQLLAKERAHDDYLFALRAIRAKTTTIERKAADGSNGFNQRIGAGQDLGVGEERDFRAAAWGYRRAMTDMAVSIVNASRQHVGS